MIALCELERGFEPGAHHHYSNVGYRAVGVVLETVTGRSYGELVQTRVLDRLGMRDSVPVMVHDTRRRLPGGHVPFYDDRPWAPAHGLVPGPWVESAEGDGCLCCSLEDLATYLRALWTGEDLLPAADLALMRTAHAGEVATERYGYGLTLEPGGFGHGGDMLGYVALPVGGHRRRARRGRRRERVRRRLRPGRGRARHRARGRRRPTRRSCRTPPLVDDGSCPAAWAAYPGRYRAQNPWLPTFSVAAQEGGLVLGTDWLDLSERFPLVPAGDAVFRVGEQPWTPERLVFDRVIGGRAQRATYSGTPYYRAFTA